MNIREYSQDDVDRWNHMHPSGSYGLLLRDHLGVGLHGVPVTTRSSAWRVGGGQALVSLIGYTGGYSIDRIVFDEPARPIPVEDAKYPGVGGSKHLPGTTIPTEDSVAGLQLIAHIPSC